MRLSALEGAIQGIRWHDLDETTKRELKDFYREAKGLSRGSGNSARRKTQ